MQIYLVGGAVRDKLLGKKAKERDFVVVGAIPKDLLSLGYQQVGKGFPVFLHPKTHEEYALARTEQKTGQGYTGFECYTGKDVTLEEDLKRRDLTINAMAEDLDGKIIDPYGGQKDLKNHTLRHVSAAFTEDPLRVLRVARFAARFHNFKIHPSTMQLLKKLVASGEINSLVKERVWQETATSLSEQAPERFWQVLEECSALEIILPEIEKNLKKALERLKKAQKLTKNPEVRFAAFLSVLDPASISKICSRLRTPSTYRELALLTSRQSYAFSHSLELNAEELLTLLEKADAFRRKERWQNFLLASECSSKQIPSPNFKYLKKAYKTASSISGAALAKKNLTGIELKENLRKERVLVLSAAFKKII
ncbi:MAG: multifunctional CCA tRNA nucleotidyl transferase/2'3'-cyclic phosphodiesterase/2'nucleotidase/phosphatase [Gammaproteobacteria bacterium]